MTKRIYVAPKLEEHGGIVAGTLGKTTSSSEGGTPPHLF
jgi:hypothetical protein